MSSTRARDAIVSGAVGALALLAIVPLVVGDTWVGNALMSGGHALVAVLIAVACHRHRRARRGDAWSWIAASLVLWAIGRGAELVLAVNSRAEPTGFAWIDVAYIASALLLVVAAVRLGTVSAARFQRAHLLVEALLVVSSVGVVAWLLVFRPVIARWVGSSTSSALLAHMLADGIALAVVVVATARRRSSTLVLLAAAILLQSIGDELVGLDRVSHAIEAGTWPGVFWAAGGIALLAAAWVRDSVTTERPWSVWQRLSLLYTPAVLGIGVLAGFLLVRGRLDPTATALGVALGLSLVANQAVAYLDNATLTASLRAKVVDLALSEERSRTMFDSLQEGVVIVSADATIIDISGRAIEMFGWSREAIRGASLAAYIHPEDLEVTVQSFVDVVERGPELEMVPPTRCRVRRADGTYLLIEAEATSMLAHPAINAVLVSARDISARHEAERALFLAQERFRVAFEDAPIGMTLVNKEGVFVQVNRAFATMLGYETHDLEGDTVMKVLGPGAELTARTTLNTLISQSPEQTTRLERRYVHRDGSDVLVAASARAISDGAGGTLIVSQIEDVTQRRAMERQLEWSVRHDDVTGLYSRAHFADQLSRSVGRLDGGHRIAVLFLDVDRFKIVNDSLGHAEGDELLREVGRRLATLVRPSDIVARLGGDEFTVLLDPAPSDTATMQLADRIRRSLAEPVKLSEGDIYVTSSIGVVFGEHEHHSAAQLLRDADAAMYRAKDLGRNRVERFDADSHRSALRALRTGNDLHRALERRELLVHYQPVVSIERNELSGFEALVRWEHPDRVLVPPSDFISLAEETGLITEIGAFVLDEALDQLVHWQQLTSDPRLTMSVNLSARQLGSPGLVEVVRDTIARHGVNPDRVWLEITESALMADVKASLRSLRSLRELGVHLTIDDFGTGYSSLTYLRRFPVEGLKIDRSFVAGIGRDVGDGAIVDAVIRLGHSLGLAVVAEGIETHAQLRHLADAGCLFGQGFLFSKPIGTHEVEVRLLAGRLVPEREVVESRPT